MSRVAMTWRNLTRVWMANAARSSPHRAKRLWTAEWIISSVSAATFETGYTSHLDQVFQPVDILSNVQNLALQRLVFRKDAIRVDPRSAPVSLIRQNSVRKAHLFRATSTSLRSKSISLRMSACFRLVWIRTGSIFMAPSSQF
jgi:hypothetical protein